ncbi:hypothetical protein L1887_20070 [Cichorium endivia]|nr:hypothetical protein L1887_20070 [Cichorium endivia]
MQWNSSMRELSCGKNSNWCGVSTAIATMVGDKGGERSQVDEEERQTMEGGLPTKTIVILVKERDPVGVDIAADLLVGRLRTTDTTHIVEEKQTMKAGNTDYDVLKKEINQIFALSQQLKTPRLIEYWRKRIPDALPFQAEVLEIRRSLHSRHPRPDSTPGIRGRRFGRGIGVSRSYR